MNRDARMKNVFPQKMTTLLAPTLQEELELLGVGRMILESQEVLEKISQRTSTESSTGGEVRNSQVDFNVQSDIECWTATEQLKSLVLGRKTPFRNGRLAEEISSRGSCDWDFP